MIQQNQTIEFNGRGLMPRQDSLPTSCRMNGFRDQYGPVGKVERSIHFMLANLNRPLQVATLAAQANVSPSHFFALFKQITGHPPIDYFTKLRMSYACRLLDSTTASVKEVAAALGYNDPFYFSRVFKSVSAVAPVHYRGLGFATRREIKDLLEPKGQITNGDPQRRGGSGRLSAVSRSSQPHIPQQDQPKTSPRT